MSRFILRSRLGTENVTNTNKSVFSNKNYCPVLQNNINITRIPGTGSIQIYNHNQNSGRNIYKNLYGNLFNIST